MSSSTINDKKVISILSTALLRCLDIDSKGRIDDCVAVGIVHSTVDKKTGDISSWIIKFDPRTCAFGIDPIETDKYPDGSILYWHEDDADSLTQAALYGDGITDEIQ